MFYENYERLCQEHGVKPYALAVQLGAKNNAVVAQWKKGAVPRQPMLEKIADYFKVPVSELLFGKEKQPTVSGELSEDEIKLLEAYRAVADQKKEIYLQILTQAAEQTP